MAVEGSGNATFKQRWGADTIQLHWYYMPVRKASVPNLTPGNPKFSVAISAWKKLPLSVTNILGPMLTRMIP